MESLRATYIDEDEDDNNNNLNSTPTECTTNTHVSPLHPIQTLSSPSQQNPLLNPLSDPPNLPEQAQPSANDEVESSSIYNNQNDDDDNNYHNVPATATTNNDNETSDHNVEEPETELEDPQQPPTTSSSEDNTITTHVAKKQKPLASFISPSPLPPATSTPLPPLPPGTAPATSTKKPKKKAINVWTKSTSRKNKKKAKIASAAAASAHQSTVLITPIPRFPDRSDDSPDAVICLSKIYKAEKVELSDDRLSAGSTKGYRMVRATRGVIEGAWYFEIKVVNLGETGHTRLGWCTEKGDLQAPVGYDGNSFGYRDVDGSKVHRAVREAYGERGYGEGDVVGCYINLPEGGSYAPKPPHLVWYKGQRYAYAADGKDDPPMVIPGSEMSFFKNGVCQGVAFTNLYGGRYYPAASMFTRPNQPNCVVKFNFGPEFEFFPQDFEGRPIPRPIIEVPYHGCDARPEGPIENGVSIENKS